MHAMFDCFKIDLSRECTGLCTLDSGKRNIWMAGNHGIDEFTDKITVATSHCLSQGRLCFVVRVTVGREELSDKSLI